MKDFTRAIVLTLVVLIASGAIAQVVGPETISEIEVVGAVTVSSKQVLAWSGLEVGRAFTRETVASGIRRLFLTQKFADIYVYQQSTLAGIKLIINLREFPRVRSITLQGNNKVKEKVKQRVIATIGRLDHLQEKGRVETVIRFLSRYFEKAMLILTGHSELDAVTIKIGPPLSFERL